MSAPDPAAAAQGEVPPPSATEVPPPSIDPEAEAGSLVPVITGIISAYLLYRAAKGAITGPWRRAAEVLGLTTMAGAVLTALAARGVSRQRSEVGRSGDELWQYADRAVIVGRDAGIRTLVEVLKSLPTEAKPPRTKQVRIPEGARTPGTKPAMSTQVPVTGPDGGGPGPVTAVDPSTVRRIAVQVAAATIESAQDSTAASAGWYKTWHTKRDVRVRPTHAAMQGTSVKAGDPFITVTGDKLMYPHDPAAPLDETIRCRCWLTWHRSAPKSKPKIKMKSAASSS